MAYGMTILSFRCLLRVGEATPIRRGRSRARGLWFHSVSVTHTSFAGSWGATARRGYDGWTGRGPRQPSRWHTSALKGPPTSKWSWRPPSTVVQAPTRGGMCGGGVGRRPCAVWVCRPDGSPGGVAGCPSQWRPTMATPQAISSWQQGGAAVAQCARGHGVGVEGCIPQGHIPGRVSGPLRAGKGCGSGRSPRGLERCINPRRVQCRPRPTS